MTSLPGNCSCSVSWHSTSSHYHATLDERILTVIQTGIVRLAEPIALTSIFPYAWSLIKQFQVGKESDASFYAGLLISAFSLTEAMMGMFWGSLSDRIGRKPVLLLGCAGTTASLLMVGFARNFWFALAARALGGMLVSLIPFWLLSPGYQGV